MRAVGNRQDGDIAGFDRFIIGHASDFSFLVANLGFELLNCLERLFFLA